MFKSFMIEGSMSIERQRDREKKRGRGEKDRSSIESEIQNRMFSS